MEAGPWFLSVEHPNEIQLKAQILLVFNPSRSPKELGSEKHSVVPPAGFALKDECHPPFLISAVIKLEI